MRITTCFRSAMVPLQPLGSALAAAERPAALAAAGPPLAPAAAAAAAPSAVACRKRRRLTPGTTSRPGCRGDPVTPCACSRDLSESVTLVHPLRPGRGSAGGGTGAEPGHPVKLAAAQSVRWRGSPRGGAGYRPGRRHGPMGCLSAVDHEHPPWLNPRWPPGRTCCDKSLCHDKCPVCAAQVALG